MLGKHTTAELEQF